jgi:hypothetical protein
MSTFEQSTTSLRAMRLRARTPRFAAYALVTILCVAGLKAIVKGPPPAPAAPTAPVANSDVAAESFAEGFVRAYLSWTREDDGSRAAALARFLPEALGDGGLDPADDTEQSVAWTAIAGDRADGARRLVTVAATVTPTGQTMYLNIPVARDRHGFLYVADYPAVVGPPATTRAPRPPALKPVADANLTAVVTRALTNYLAGARANLLADLTPDAVVSLPPQHLRLSGVGDVTWARPGSRVSVEVDATGAGAGRWTLRYALEVRKRDRWYVQSVQVDPASKGAR